MKAKKVKCVVCKTSYILSYPHPIKENEKEKGIKDYDMTIKLKQTCHTCKCPIVLSTKKVSSVFPKKEMYAVGIFGYVRKMFNWEVSLLENKMGSTYKKVKKGL